MRTAVTVFFLSLSIISTIIFVGIGRVITGPLNVREFFTDRVQSELEDWSQCLLQGGSKKYYCDKRSCPDSLRKVMESFGVLNVCVSQEENKVDWLLDGNFRVQIHYICLPREGKRTTRDNCKWKFNLEGESVSPKTLMSVLIARQNKCKICIVVFFFLTCIALSSCCCHFFDRIRKMVPKFIWISAIGIVWIANMYLVCIAGMGFFIMLTDWMRK